MTISITLYTYSITIQWKVDPFLPTDNKAGAFTEESSFATLFPKYREKYLREVWSAVTRALETHVCFYSSLYCLIVTIIPGRGLHSRSCSRFHVCTDDKKNL